MWYWIPSQSWTKYHPVEIPATLLLHLPHISVLVTCCTFPIYQCWLQLNYWQLFITFFWHHRPAFLVLQFSQFVMQHLEKVIWQRSIYGKLFHLFTLSKSLKKFQEGGWTWNTVLLSPDCTNIKYDSCPDVLSYCCWASMLQTRKNVQVL